MFRLQTELKWPKFIVQEARRRSGLSPWCFRRRGNSACWVATIFFFFFFTDFRENIQNLIKRANFFERNMIKSSESCVFTTSGPDIGNVVNDYSSCKQDFSGGIWIYFGFGETKYYLNITNNLNEGALHWVQQLSFIVPKCDRFSVLIFVTGWISIWKERILHYKMYEFDHFRPKLLF